jgi:hypothetical protein
LPGKHDGLRAAIPAETTCERQHPSRRCFALRIEHTDENHRKQEMYDETADAAGECDHRRGGGARVRADRFRERIRAGCRELLPLRSQSLAGHRNIRKPRRWGAESVREIRANDRDEIRRSIEQRVDGDPERHDHEDRDDHDHHRRGERAAPADTGLHPQQQRPCGDHDRRGPYQRADER